MTAPDTPTGYLLTQTVTLQDRYQEVVKETLGTITPFQEKFTVMKDAKPRSFKL